MHVLLHKALSDDRRRGYVGANVIDALDPPSKDDSIQRQAFVDRPQGFSGSGGNSMGSCRRLPSSLWGI
jgi:hypothetical protein